MQVGDRVLFKGYNGNPTDYEPVLAAGDICLIEAGDREAGFTVRKVAAQPHDTTTTWVFAEEVMPLPPATLPGDPRPDPRKVLKMMARENTKDFADLRDRVAYMYVTGAHPTNMRPFFTGALNMLSAHYAASRRFGPRLIDGSAIYTLDLDRHPMVVEARRLLVAGWRLVVSLGPNQRRPYGNLYFASGQQRLSVNAEGWVKPGWPVAWERRSTRR